MIERITLFIVLTALTVACGSEGDQTQNMQQPDPAASEQQTPDFAERIAELEAQEQTEETLAELEQAHLDYGIYLIYNTDPSKMRENANNALREFIAVLEINPENEKAMAEIDQIMSIYASFPDRSPDEEIVEKLRELGFNY